MEPQADEGGSRLPVGPGELLWLDGSFLRRVYGVSVGLGLLGALFLAAKLSRGAAVGFLYGVALSLGLLVTLEWGVRRLVRPGSELRSVLKLQGLLFLHFLAGGGLVVLAFVLARRGWLSLLWLLPGYGLPHVVFGMKLLGRWLTAAR